MPEIETKKNKEIFYKIKSYLEASNIKFDETIIQKIKKRKNGHTFSLSEHLRGMVFSLLSSQIDWSIILKNKQKIEEIFFHFDVENIKAQIEASDEYFFSELKNIKCVTQSTNKQMKALLYNIKIFEEIQKKYGSVDEFISSKNPLEVIKILNTEYKLKEMAEALIAEYLRNVGIDIGKPDTHIRRILGRERLGFSLNKNVNAIEAIEIMDKIADSIKCNYKAEIDYLLWNYCAKSFGNVCGSKPKCDICVVREHCKKIIVPSQIEQPVKNYSVSKRKELAHGISKQEQSKNSVLHAQEIFQNLNYQILENINASTRYKSSFLIKKDQQSREIHVRSLNYNNLSCYTFICKKDIKINQDTYVVLILYYLDEEEIFLIPSTVWLYPESPFVDRDYNKPGQKSLPEWGIQVSRKNMDTLRQYQLYKTIKTKWW